MDMLTMRTLRLNHSSNEIVSCDDIPVDSVGVLLTENLLMIAPDDSVHTAAGIQQEENGKPGVGVVAELAHGGELFRFDWVCC